MAQIHLFWFRFWCGLTRWRSLIKYMYRFTSVTCLVHLACVSDMNPSGVGSGSSVAFVWCFVFRMDSPSVRVGCGWDSPDVGLVLTRSAWWVLPQARTHLLIALALASTVRAGDLCSCRSYAVVSERQESSCLHRQLGAALTSLLCG